MTVVALSGCGLFVNKPASAPPQQQTKEKEALVTKVLKDVKPLTEIDGVPSSQQFFEHMLEAGYKPENLEATIDRSPLDHDVPSKMFGVKIKEGCVIGEVRQGSVSGSLVEPNASTKSCLYGDVDRPEGVEPPKGDERSDKDEDNGVGHLPGDDLHERKADDSSEDSDIPEEENTPQPKKKKKKKENSESGSSNSIG